MDSPAEDVPGDLPPPLPPRILHKRDCRGNEQCARRGRYCAADDWGDGSLHDVAADELLHEVAGLLLAIFTTDDDDTGRQQ